MNVTDVTIGIAGAGGDGVITAGDILVSAASRCGLFCFMLKSFGAQIRGGESSCRVRFSRDQVLSQGDKLNILAVFNWDDFGRFKEELIVKDGVIVLVDEKDNTPQDRIPLDFSMVQAFYKIPFTGIAREKAGSTLAKNIVLVGVLGELFNFPTDNLEEIIHRRFMGKSDKIIEANYNALHAGMEYTRKNVKKRDDLIFECITDSPKVVMEGNQAIAYGALYAGCRFYTGYPITPSSEIMEWLARELPKFDGVVVQTEDEISALGMVIGASFAGKKAMTSTSGPGLSLMSEMIGLAGAAESPCVIVDVQRVGPSTGI
ncbi:MAG: 2-oxoacid:acceptor oxidoreductase family protein, partial [Fidelibacterota bacterium]